MQATTMKFPVSEMTWEMMGDSSTLEWLSGLMVPANLKLIIKYDPINDTTSIVGEETDEWFYCVMGRDGCIYVLANNCRVLKIDAANNSRGYVGNTIQFAGGDAILGFDGCIYWPAPKNDRRILRKYDPHSNQTSFVGDNFDCNYDGKFAVLQF